MTVSPMASAAGLDSDEDHFEWQRDLRPVGASPGTQTQGASLGSLYGLVS